MEPEGGKDTTLVHWDGQHESEAACEDEEVFAEDFPNANLEDKVVSEGMGNDKKSVWWTDYNK